MIIFTMLQMFMNNVHLHPLPLKLEHPVKTPSGELGLLGVWWGKGRTQARRITLRGDLTTCAELCDHSKLLIISLTYLISAVMKENR